MLGSRVANNYLNLVQALARADADTIWRPARAPHPIAVTPVGWRHVKVILEQEAPPLIEDRLVRGWLFRADARDHNFLFAREEDPEERLPGRYPPALREKVRGAWDTLVEIRAIVTEYRPLRHQETTRTELDLLDVVEVLAEHKEE